MPSRFAVHPGRILRDMMADDISATELSQHIGISRARLLRILDGGASIDAPLAIRLAEAFAKTDPDRDAKFWLDLQSTYDLAKAFRAKGMRVSPIRLRKESPDESDSYAK